MSPDEGDPAALWSAALQSLQAQTTRGTFDTWLRGTTAALGADGELIVAVPTIYAQEWLDGRLRPVIESTLAALGHHSALAFVVSATTTGARARDEVAVAAEALRPPPKASVQLVDFDPTTRGWIQVPAYAIQFWQPYLGPGAFALWQAIRSYAQAGDAWPSIASLADILANGDKQKLIGRAARNQRGWLAILEEERLLWFKRKGQDYIFRVLDRLPLLTPAQVATLPAKRRAAHDRFLAQAQIDRDEWQQLTLGSLTKGIRG